MNAFADWLFGIILGWTRGLANAGWNLVANHSGGLSELFGRIWLPLLIGLVIAGSAMDYIVWFIRWRPQRSWRDHRARRFHARASRQEAQTLADTDMPEDYRNMVSGWVQEDEDSMPLPENFHAEPLPDQYKPANAYSDAYPDGYQPASPYAAASTDGYDGYEPVQAVTPEISIAWRPATGVTNKTASPYTGQPDNIRHPGYPEENGVERSERRRRSERKHGVLDMLHTVRSGLRSNREEDITPRESVFRDPVYPPMYGQNPPGQQENPDQQRR